MQDVQQIRNVVVLGHGNSGKSSLAEALLFTAGSLKRLGKVDDGTSSMDFEPEEIKRKISIGAAFNHLSWKKNDVYLIDTPGDDSWRDGKLPEALRRARAHPDWSSLNPGARLEQVERRQPVDALASELQR